MPLVQTRIDITSNFPQITREVNELAKRAVETGAREGANAARKIALQRVGDHHKSGPRMSDITPDNAVGTPDGWRASFVSPVYYAWFQNYGTLGSRKRKLSASTLSRRSSGSGQERFSKVQGREGIEPLGFLEAGRRVGRAAMKRVIAGGL